MKTLVTLCFMALLGLVLAQDDRGPCGCTRSFDFCANDLNTYHSICEYKCKNPSTSFQEWYILYHGPCLSQLAYKVALVGRVLTQDGPGPCGCTRSFDFCANDLNTYHSICEYKCKNPSTSFQEWYILYHGPCLSQLAYKVALVGRVLTQDGRGPCGCETSFDFCANDLNTYRSICEYKCKNPSTPFKEWYVLYHGPCRGQQTEAGMETTTTRPSEVSSKDQCVKSDKSHKGYRWEPRTGSYYKFHRLAKTWHKAQATCHAEDGHLAIINSQTESTVLKEIYDKNPSETIIGADDYRYAFIGFYKYYDDVWATINGDTLAEAGFEEWAPTRPNNYEDKASCGSVSQNGQLNDINGQMKCPFVCEITLNY